MISDDGKSYLLYPGKDENISEWLSNIKVFFAISSNIVYFIHVGRFLKSSKAYSFGIVNVCFKCISLVMITKNI